MGAPGTGGAGLSGYGNTYSEKCKVSPFAVGCAVPPGEEPTMPPEVETPRPPTRTPSKPTPAADKPPSWIHRIWPFGTAAAKDSGSQKDAVPPTPDSKLAGIPAPATEATSEPLRPESLQRPQGEPAGKGLGVEAAKKKPSEGAPKKKPSEDAPKETPLKKAPREKPTKAPEINPDVSDYPPGKRPCTFAGTGGNGLGRGERVAGEIVCRYNCGGKTKERLVWGRAADAELLCRRVIPTW